MLSFLLFQQFPSSTEQLRPSKSKFLTLDIKHLKELESMHDLVYFISKIVNFLLCIISANAFI